MLLFHADPDPARRPGPRTGNPGVDARLAALRAVQPAETINPLHALMPEVSVHARRSLLYGVVPTSEPLSSTPLRYTSIVCAAALYTPVTKYH